MTIPGLSGSYILMLLGNYVLLLVDAVNVLNDVLISCLQGDYSILSNPYHQEYLKLIAIFTLGSFVGLVSFSILLSYLLKRWSSIINALIIGFITGSLSTVWPWKNKIYASVNGEYLLNKLQHKIIINYQSFLPDISMSSTWVAVLFIVIGIAIVLGIERFSKK